MRTTVTMRDLRVWDAARGLANAVQRASGAAHSRRARDLWGKARRAAESVGANIAEGCGRPFLADRRRFFGIALGSLRETQHHLRLCRDYGVLVETEYLRLAGLTSVTRRMLESLMGRLD